MIKLLQIIIIIIGISSPLFSQNTTSGPKEILVKLSENNSKLLKSSKTQQIELNSFVKSLPQTTLVQVFPNSKKPETDTNKYGQRMIDLSRWYRVETNSKSSNNEIIEDLDKTNLFENIETSPEVEFLTTITNDPYLGNQYYLNNIKAYDAWDIEKGDTNIVVAITDSGIDKLHSDLKGSIKYNYEDTIDGIDNDNDGYIDNFCGWDIGCNDNNTQWSVLGHGTFVSGFVSGTPNNAIGICGVGFNTKILPVKIDDTLGYIYKTYEGIVYAADHGASIINCSWGGYGKSQFGEDVIDYAHNNKGALIIAACGNNSNNLLMYPASYDNVMSCAATNINDIKWTNSSYGDFVDVSAPGESVFSTWINDQYSTSSGTSFSSPIVAGVAALVKAHFPNFTNDQIQEQIRVTSDNIDTLAANKPFAYNLGAGRVNAYKALTDTTKPSFRFINYTIKQINDSIIISGDFLNYLHKSSSNANVNISSKNSYLKGVDTAFSIGAVNTLGRVNNKPQAFVFIISPNTPMHYYTTLKLSYSDTNYNGFENIRLLVNNSLSELDTNYVHTSVNSYSTIGYTNVQKNYGKGLNYKDGVNLLNYAGLIVGTDSIKISNNIDYEADFNPMSASNYVNNSYGAQMWLNKYNDNNAGLDKLNIEVNQYSFAFKNNPLDKTIFLNYKIINKGNTPLNNIYTGIYVSWILQNGYQDFAQYNSPLKLAYTSSALGGVLTGLQLVSDSAAICYNIDNNGDNGSIYIDDYFSSTEKWKSISTNRYFAGGTNGNEVSSVVSSGPSNILPNDTLDLLFALIVADNITDLNNSASANKIWYKTLGIKQPIDQLNMKLYQNTPNPSNGKTEISFDLKNSENITLSLLDANGNNIKTLLNSRLQEGHHSYSFDFSYLPAGIYYYQLSNNKCYITNKMIIL